MSAAPAPDISVIIPVLNEAPGIAVTLQDLEAWRRAGDEVVVVDGGSSDGSAALCRELADRVVTAPRGRALQMNAGAAQSSGALLLFLHADTRITPACRRALLTAGTGRPLWGRFDVVLSGPGTQFRIIERLINLRSRLSGIATGDQAIFVSRPLFDAVGGFPEQPLMEDVALSRRLRRRMRPVCLSERVKTSSRRWERGGVWRTVLLMWFLRSAYALGVPPRVLARLYR